MKKKILIIAICSMTLSFLDANEADTEKKESDQTEAIGSNQAKVSTTQQAPIAAKANANLPGKCKLRESSQKFYRMLLKYAPQGMRPFLKTRLDESKRKLENCPDDEVDTGAKAKKGE